MANFIKFISEPIVGAICSALVYCFCGAGIALTCVGIVNQRREEREYELERLEKQGDNDNTKTNDRGDI